MAMTRKFRKLLPLLGVAMTGSPALANDSIAELGTGGLILSRTDAITMAKEDLFISMDKVTVDYVFKNETDKDVEAIVAFPMPEIEANPYSMPALPDDTSDNFLGFEVTLDGKAVKPQLDQRAFAVELDVTDLLRANGIPINPFAKPALEALEKLSVDMAQDWIDRGMIFVDTYDDGSGWKNVRTPLWGLRSTYWWTSKFPAGKEVKVAHNYKPSVGATVGLTFFSEGKFAGTYAAYKEKYCIDEAFERAVRKAAGDSPDGYPRLTETRIDYVLTTGGNWALGNIGDFKLTIDKGDAKNLVSFCAAGVKKTGPTTFEWRQQEFYPQRDMEILILEHYQDGEPMAAAAPARKLDGASRTFDAKADGQLK